MYNYFRYVFISRLAYIFRNKRFDLFINLFKNKNNDFWINYDAKEWFLKNAKNKRVFEYGAGYSTEYISKVAKELISVEHDKDWLNKINSDSKIIYADNKETYINSIENKGLFDIVFVDGIYRKDCILKAMNYIKKNGLLVIDDINNNSLKRFGMTFKEMYSNKPHYKFGNFKSNTGGYWETGVIVNV